VSRATTYKSATTDVLKGRLEALEGQLAMVGRRNLIPG